MKKLYWTLKEFNFKVLNIWDYSFKLEWAYSCNKDVRELIIQDSLIS